MEKKQYSLNLGDKKFEFELGVLAQQCNGSCVCKYGDTMVLATCAIQREAREGIDFLPLLVNYQEKYYASGVIGGVRFTRREGRPPVNKILAGRLIDRGLRSMLPNDLRKSIQVMLTVLSYDFEHSHDIVAANAASLAVALSDCPFDQPIGTVRVGMVNNEFVLNPSEEVQKKMEGDFIITANDKHVVMVEGDADEISEEKFLEAILFGKKWAQKIAAFIKDIQKELGKEKFEVPKITYNEEVTQFISETYNKQICDAIYNIPGKIERYNQIFAIKKDVKEKVEEKFGEDLVNEVNPIIDKMVKTEVKKNIIENDRRIANRKIDEIRPIICEIDLLPRTHGSALFQRGETQGLTITTLGSSSSKLWIENMEGSKKERYFHHYNFPPFSVGEVSNRLFTGNRELGHGMLAERAIKRMLPKEEDFPYTIRTVTEILQSNGSSSMAATCGSTLSLMAAGVPIKAPVAGIAMGLMSDEEKDIYKVITDLQDEEDFGGDMDFKLTGTKNGITAIQIDIKINGLPDKVLKIAVEKARKAHFVLLEAMAKAIPEPRKELSKYAPRLYTIKVDPTLIRIIIGRGGETINKIIEETGAEIDISDDGTVIISSTDAEMANKAIDWIKDLTAVPEVGKIYEGTVVKIIDGVGAIVEFLPSHDGLVHISMLSKNGFVKNVNDVVKVKDKVKVKVMEIDNQGRNRLSMKDTE